MSECVTMPREDYQAICDTIREASGKTNLIKSGDLSAEVSALANQIGKVGFKSSPLPDDFSVYRMAYGGGTFVAMSGEGSFAYSTDGINWTRNDFKTKEPHSPILSYCNGKFIASDYYYMYTSNDGINWSCNNKSFNQRLLPNKVVYGNGKYVVCGSHNIGTGYNAGYNFAYSDDGLNWTCGAVVSEYLKLYTLIFDGTRFITCGEFKSDSPITPNEIGWYTSVDGKNWTKLNSNIKNGLSNGTLCYGNNKYACIVTHGETTDNNKPIYHLMSSSDCINWVDTGKTMTSSSLISFVCSLIYGNGKFLLTYDHFEGQYIANNSCYYSTDCINWTKIESLPAGYYTYHLSYSPNCYIAIYDRISATKAYYLNLNDAGIW